MANRLRPRARTAVERSSYNSLMEDPKCWPNFEEHLKRSTSAR